MTLNNINLVTEGRGMALSHFMSAKVKNMQNTWETSNSLLLPRSRNAKTIQALVKSAQIRSCQHGILKRK
jgi:hypothetical protein